ncbi:acyl-CoA synthetase (AMP-forming)/AMP-acid ligase II [Spinactinospora alkalitolerans]|uniref:Acyl-CoA synthetase (AMP-forming)/AMP-acid ligase II n=1 Tax=Spinactinospora alkalitolerans TaxID=687207 RepID=A0A852TS34_9ACTN|nr:AMP-binding protein [Spinactinospora alkalitolerans]NYE46097.1 acyl-CoA synthetase (AMP-forming)/AMP-acid ligase II [Spinactinospora alkalitolerans]
MEVDRPSGSSRAERPVPPDARASPAGSLTGGLLERLRRRDRRSFVADSLGGRIGAVEFAGTVERAASGLGRRGIRPDDTVGILAPVGTARLTAVYAAMAAGGVALPLELASDLETLIDVLVETDTRLIVVTAALADVALELAERSRVRQVVAFGGAPETTPFDELLLPSPGGAAPVPPRGRSGSGVLSYAPCSGRGVRTALHSHADLLGRFHRLGDELGVTGSDVVAVENGMAESDRAALAAVALWNGASVVAVALDDEEGGRRVLAGFGATVRGRPVPRRIGVPA